MTTLSELDFSTLSVGQQGDYVRKAFYTWWKNAYGRPDEHEWDMRVYVREVYIAHPTLDNAVIADNEGSTYAIPFTIDPAGM